MEAVIFVGIQGAGKSTYYRERFFDTHVRINLDMLKTRRREQILLDACIAAGQRFVVDNTNVTARDRLKYIEPARRSGFRVVGYFFDVSPIEAARRNAGRTGKQRVPKSAVFGTHRRLEPPAFAEGFDDIFCVSIDDRGEFEGEQIKQDQ
jgi:predicted kinase